MEWTQRFPKKETTPFHSRTKEIPEWSLTQGFPNSWMKLSGVFTPSHRADRSVLRQKRSRRRWARPRRPPAAASTAPPPWPTKSRWAAGAAPGRPAPGDRCRGQSAGSWFGGGICELVVWYGLVVQEPSVQIQIQTTHPNSATKACLMTGPPLLFDFTNSKKRGSYAMLHLKTTLRGSSDKGHV